MNTRIDWSNKVLRRLKSLNFDLKLEASMFNKIHYFSAYENESNLSISDDVYCGVDIDPISALNKSISEFCERYIFRCQSIHSSTDGWAAYPNFFPKQDTSKKLAELNALNEAKERCVWANWWDDNSFQHHLHIYNVNDFLHNYTYLKPFIKLISNYFRIEKIFIAKPVYQVFDLIENNVNLIFIKLKNYGYISGGACSEFEKDALFSAMSELFRHAIALKRELSINNETTSYIKRLRYFGFGQGNEEVKNRLYSHGSRIIKLDKPREHLTNNSLEDLISLAIFKFENQPTFLGGPVNRFCL